MDALGLGLEGLGGRGTVHPRVCGEQECGACRPGRTVRFIPACAGTAAVHSHILAKFRFIPACAGNRAKALSKYCDNAVHPRVCGEQIEGEVDGNSHRGSSPRVRGTGGGQILDGLRGRFIPACAGNRAGPIASRRAGAVHPRVCGEQPIAVVAVSGRSGSSPRVRGTGDVCGKGHDGLRFIPACAGNRATAAISLSLKPVHPRVCGEQRWP